MLFDVYKYLRPTYVHTIINNSRRNHGELCSASQGYIIYCADMRVILLKVTTYRIVAEYPNHILLYTTHIVVITCLSCEKAVYRRLFRVEYKVLSPAMLPDFSHSGRTKLAAV